MVTAKIRTCVVCGEKYCKDELVRFVGTPEGVVIDKTGRMPGRGAYICLHHTELGEERSRRNLERTLRTSVDKNVFAGLVNDYNLLCATHSDVQ